MKKNARKAFIVLSIAVLVFSSGCLEITFHQKLKRSGKYDLNITYKSETPEILNVMKDSIKVKSQMSKRVTYTETDKTASYYITDIDPRYEVPFASEDDTPSKKTITFDREFKFPYYHYTMKWDFTGISAKEKTEYDELYSNMFKFNNVVEVFGKIEKTNGKRLGDKKVTFDFTDTAGKEYYVEFKDFFLFSLAGALFGGGIDVGLHPYSLIGLFIEIMLGIGYVFFLILLFAFNHFTGKLSNWNHYHKFKIFLILLFLILVFMIILTTIVGVIANEDVPTTTRAILEYQEPDTSSLLGGSSGGSTGGTVKASCSDGIKNGDEVSVDCGGSCNVRCAYSVDNCFTGHKYTYQTQNYNTAELTEQGLTTKDGHNCCHTTIILDSTYSGKIRYEMYDCENNVHFSEMYDKGGKTTGTIGAYIGKTFYDSTGNVLNGTSCIDGIRNQGEERTDCGGPCKACPTVSATLEILKVDAEWSEWTDKGYLRSISYKISNTGEAQIDPSFDITVTKGGTTIDTEYGESGSIWYLNSGETKMDEIWYSHTVTQKGTYTVKIDLREGSNTDIIATASKQVTV